MGYSGKPAPGCGAGFLLCGRCGLQADFFGAAAGHFDEDAAGGVFDTDTLQRVPYWGGALRLDGQDCRGGAVNLDGVSGCGVDMVCCFKINDTVMGIMALKL